MEGFWGYEKYVVGGLGFTEKGFYVTYIFGFMKGTRGFRIVRTLHALEVIDLALWYCLYGMTDWQSQLTQISHIRPVVSADSA